MIEKRITAKVDRVIKTGSLEEEQVQEIHQIDDLLSESKQQESEIQTEEEKKE